MLYTLLSSFGDYDDDGPHQFSLSVFVLVKSTPPREMLQREREGEGGVRETLLFHVDSISLSLSLSLRSISPASS